MHTRSRFGLFGILAALTPLLALNHCALVWGITDLPPPDASTTDAPSAKYSFADDFDRPDTDGGLGNGWIAKGNTFLIHSNTAERVVNDGNDYADNIQTRPPSEAVGDVEVSVELKLTSLTPCSPQIHARVTPGSVSVANTLDSYILYLDNDATYSTWIVARQHGMATTPDPLDKLTATLDAGSWFRLTLRVTGSNPVVLFASIEKKSGANWTPIASHSTNDATSVRIEQGVVGLGAGKGLGYETTGQYAYDNFIAKAP